MNSGPTDPPGSLVGERIARYRRRLGLSQAELAARVGRSTGWLANIEQGSRGVDRLPLLARLADALDVSVADLHPDAADPAAGPGDRDPTGLLAVLSGYAALGARSTPPADLDTLAVSVAALWDLAHQVRYRPLVDQLAELLPALDAGAAQPHPGRSGRRWHRLRSEAYQTAAAALARLGEPAGAWVAADRAVSAALDSKDPRLAASAVLRAARLFITEGRLIQAEHAANAVATATGGSHPGDLSLAGTAHLVLAEVHAARNHRQDARHHLQVAAELAETVGDGHDWFGTEFGPTNVGLHALHVAVALHDAGQAVDIAARLDVSGLSPERQARYLLDYARAELLRRQPRHALRLLIQADQLSPEQTSHEPDAREAIRDLAGFSQRVRGGPKELNQLRQRSEHQPD